VKSALQVARLIPTVPIKIIIKLNTSITKLLKFYLFCKSLLVKPSFALPKYSKQQNNKSEDKQQQRIQQKG
jgi:hypothetical protein